MDHSPPPSAQERFVKVMSHNAELAEQAQEAEMVVLALEGENATIGEYIALYHERRSALQHRFKEKDDFIDRLLGEREQLKVGEHQSCLWSHPRTAAVLRAPSCAEFFLSAILL